MTTQQPEALKLADMLRDTADMQLHIRAADELLRLHAESELHLQELRSYRITVENREARIAELERMLAATPQPPACNPSMQPLTELATKVAPVQMPEHIGTLEEHKYGLAPYGVRWSHMNKRTPKNGEKIYAEGDLRHLLAQHGIKQPIT